MSLRKILTILLNCLLLAAPAALANSTPQFTYITNNGALTISNYIGFGGGVAIPASVSGMSVVGIGSNAFNLPAGATVTSVTIPEGVLFIDFGAFSFCSNMTLVTIPNSMTNIGEGAFNKCTDLTSVAISNTATVISDYAFQFCTGLTSVLVPGNMTNAASVFYGCAHLNSVTIAEGSSVVFNQEFEFFTNLTSVTIPDSVIDIGYASFYACSNLASVNLSAGVVDIGEFAFGSCVKLPGIVLPDTVTGIESNAFNDDTALASLAIPASVTNIGGDSFEKCASLTNLLLLGGSPVIGGYAFIGCSNLATVAILGNVSSFGYASFAYCAKLTSIFFAGNAPASPANTLVVFFGDTKAKVYHLAGATGWSSTFAGLQTVVLNAPAITTSPANETVAANGTASFSVKASADLLHYQWLFDNAPLSDGGNISGAATDKLTVSAVQTGDLGSYSVIVTNYAGAAPSATAQLSFVAGKTAPLSGLLVVQTNGNGTVSPSADTNKYFTVGISNTVTAVPGKNWIFYDWISASDGAILSTNASYKFALESTNTLTIQANFVTNLFLAAGGAYHGLFAPDGQPRQQTNSGAFTLNVTSAGSISGDLYLGSASGIRLNGKFGLDGTATIMTKHGKSTLTTVLILNLGNHSVSGAVSDGSFTAPLYGDQLVFNSKNPAPYAGQYTFVIPGHRISTIGPAGFSYGAIKVTSLGAITFSGSLADGTAVSQSSYVSEDGAWPFYLPLYNGKGSIYSWNSFTDASGGIITFSFNGSWLNATNTAAGAAYKTGFTNDAVDIYGSAYTTNVLALPGGEGVVTLAGGGLATSVTDDISLAANDKVTVTANADKLTLNITKSDGIISGTFTNGSKTIHVGGVLFDSLGEAFGYFLGTNQTSGTFNLNAP